MVKFRLYYDKDKETKWLNEMAAQGKYMSSFVGGFYTFEEGEPGKYEYQIDFGTKFGSVSEDYREFMKDAGIEVVQVWGPWVILRKETSEEPFTLYSDVDSQIEQYKKILAMFKGVAIFELLILLFEIYGYSRTQSIVTLVCIFIIAAITLTIIKAGIGTKNILHKLNERKTGIAEKENKQLSALLPTGLLCNSCALLLQDSISAPIRYIVQILAIVLMLAGLILTCQKKKEMD